MIKVVRGEDKTAIITITGLPDLTTATAISVQFPSLGSAIIKTLGSGVVASSATTLTVTTTQADSAKFPVSSPDDIANNVGQEIEVVVDYGGVRRILQDPVLIAIPKLF